MNDLTMHVRHFVPDAEGEDLELRKTLLKARDFAAALRGKTISRRAYEHACDAHETAGEFVFADVSTTVLDQATKYCRHLVTAAWLAELFEGEGGGR